MNLGTATACESLDRLEDRNLEDSSEIMQYTIPVAVITMNTVRLAPNFGVPLSVLNTPFLPLLLKYTTLDGEEAQIVKDLNATA